MAALRVLGSPDPCLKLTVSSDESASTDNIERAPGRQRTALSTRAVLCLLSMVLLGGLAKKPLQAQTAYFSGAVTTLGGGFSQPTGVAVDGSGNIYVSDPSNDTLYEMPPGCASSSCVTTLLTPGTITDPIALAIDGSGNLYVSGNVYVPPSQTPIQEVPTGCTSSSCVISLSNGNDGERAYGLAVDSSGNVYSADPGGNEVWQIPAGCTFARYAAHDCLGVKLGGGFGGPDGLAVGGSGYVYVADTSDNAVKKMLTSCTYADYYNVPPECTVTTLPLAGSFYHPYALEVDGSGNVYVADEGPGSVVKEIPAGCASSSCVTFLGGGFNELTGLTLDGSGNVYVADAGNGAVQEIIPPEHGVNFGGVAVGNTSTALTLYFTFAGSDSDITASVLTQGAKGLDFTDAVTGTCDTYGTLHEYSATNTCTMNVTFSPKYAGARYGAVQLSDASGVIATAYIYGTGQGPQLVFPSNQTITTLGGGFSQPYGVALDGAGNVYVADWRNSVVKEMPAACASSSCVTTLGSGFSYPTGVAVDGAGNVYVDDSSNNAVKEMPTGCVSSGCVTTLGSGFSSPYGVAVDGAGNVYVADLGNSAVKRMPADCGSSDCVTTLGSGFISPTGVAVDGNGNIYVADTGNNAVKEMPSGCGSSNCVTTLGGGFYYPIGVAVDASGNVYVADTDNSAMKEIPSGCAYSSCVTTLGSGFRYPTGVALDTSGNVYVADNDNNAVKELNAAALPSLSFANTNVGSQSSDSPQTATLRNIGNAPLIFPAPGAGQNPSISANFTLDSSTTCPEVSTSSSAGTLAVGATCALAVDFIPTTAGPISGTAVLTDNNLNVVNATQTIELNGTGLEAAISVSIGTSPAGLSFSISGTPYTTTQTPSLTVGNSYTLATTSPQTGMPGVQYVFSQWSDGTTSLTDTLTPTASTTGDVADFTAQYLLTVTAGSGGTLAATTSPNGFYNAGTVQALAATPNAGYYFTGWTGANSPSDIASVTSASTTVTMNGPENLTANFAPIPGYQVTTLNDDATGNAGNCSPPSSSCTLRDAITAAEANNGSVGTITFASGLTGTITLTSALPALSGQINVAGPGAGSLTISGGNSQTVGSIFTVNNDAVVAFSGITIANGNSATGNGGGIDNSGTLTVSNSTVSGNTASGNGGGGIYSSGTLVVSGSSIFGNAAYYGAGIAARGGSVAVSSSTISDNASFYGAGIDFGGGALTLTVVNSTIFGNTGNYGGGIHVYSGTVTVSSTTISGNTGIQGGAGIYNQYGALIVNNSILAGDTGYDECDYTACPSNGSNGNVVGVAANLAPLGNYGGPTQTLLPLPGSAAICGGLAANIPTGVNTDQRGYPNTNTSYPGYSSNSPCVDVGAVQTNYALSFTTDPPSTGTIPTLAMSPAPAVTVTENGNALTGGSASLSITDTNSDLTTSPATATTSSSNGQATFSTLIFTGATSNDTLTASLTLNPNITGPNLTTFSTSFSVVAPVIVTIGTSPAGLSFSINGTPYSTTQTPSLTIGTRYTLATSSPQTGGPGVQYVFSQWSDGTTSLTDTLTPTASTTGDVADFTTQYLLAVTAGTGGTIVASTSPNGFYNPQTVQTITATPNAGYYFTGWKGANSPSDIASATSTSTTVTMNGPESLTANFVPIPGYQVTTLNDDATGNAGNCAPASSSCTLRDAITAAEANNGGAGSITFASSLTGTITLTSALPALSGQINIAGPGASNLTISGGNSQTVGSIFTVNPGANAAISGITISNGVTAGYYASGGGIANNGNLTVSNSTISGNIAVGYGNGGGIANSGTLTIIDSTVSGNNVNSEAAGGDGGGIINVGTLTMIDSTVAGNFAFYIGGGIWNDGGTLMLINSTVSGNTSGPNGGVGGGILSNAGGTVTLLNSIVAGNASDSYSGDDCDSCGTQSPYNLISTPSSIINPMLASLGNYGGPTQTVLPLPGSAAICAGSPSLVPAGLTTDQRGFARQNTSYTGYSANTPCVDIGAVQTNYTLSFTSDPPSTGTLPTFAMSPAPAVTVTESGNALSGGSASVNVTDANSDLTTSPVTATTSISNGQAAFSNLIFTAATSNDALTASLALNSNIGLNLTTASTSFSVAAATPTVTWPTAGAITYGQTLASSTLSGGSASFGGPSVPGSFAFTNPSTAPSAGTQTESVTFTPSNTSAYNSVSGTVGVLVNKAMPTVAFTGAPADAPYEGTFVVTETTNASTTAVIMASGSCSITGTTVTITSPSGTCSLKATWAADNNYLAASATQSTTATQAMPMITWAAPAAITYGTALSGTQLDATATYNGATVAGTFVYTPAKGTVLTAGTQTLSVTFTPNKTADFTSANASVMLQVNQATPKITWAKPAAITYATALSSTQLDATASVPGTFAYSPAVGAILTAGSQALSVTFTPTDAVDYTTAADSVTITVDQAKPAITWATPAAITYGTALSSIQLDATASIPGTFVYSPAAGAIEKGGSDTLSVTFTPTDNVDYTTATASVTLQVNPAVPTITWATPAAITYGTALSGTQLDATATYNGATVAGTFVYSPVKGTVLTAGTQTLSVTFTPTNATNYTAPPSASVTLQVNQATPKITWAKPVAITYGTALTTTQLDATASVAGTFTYLPTAGTVLGGGAQTLSVSFTPTDTTDYTTATDSVTITVNTTTSTTTITSNTPNPTTVGEVVTVDFSVTGANGVPTGSVTVTASTGESCSGSLGVAAAGSCTLTFTATGSPKLTAVYGGDSNFKSSTSAKVTETVN